MRTASAIGVVCALAVGAQLVAHPAAAQTGGTIEGHVKLTGAPPAPVAIRMGADPNCLKIHAGKRIFQETVVKAADGGLANVFAYVKGSFPKGAPATSAVIDQQGCLYHPRIQGAQVGQTIEVKNSDATLHNIHSMTAKDNSFNVGQARAGMIFKYQLKSEEVMLRLKCDVHPWMTGYLGVVSHPYFGVSDAAGTFKIAGVPEGKQTVEVWHEAYGPLTATVDVKRGATATVEFTYAGTEKPAAASGLPEEPLTLPGEATAVQLVAVSQK